MKNITSIETGILESCEEFSGERQEMCLTDSERYLGQIISNDGSNTKNITSRYNRGISINNKIIQMLHTMPGGKYHFEVFVIYRNAYLLSSILYGSETWYSLSKEDIYKLESVDLLV